MKRLSTSLRIQLLGKVSILAACLLGAATAHADCRLKAAAPQDLVLPSRMLAAAPDMPVGSTIGSVRVATERDIPFVCSGTSNVREAKLTDTFAPVPGFSRVFATNVIGVGLRVTASGGNFAGIDDTSRPAPYKVAVPAEADRLTGFALQVDFVKTGPIQDGVLAAGRLLSVRIGETDIVDVDIPANAIVFTSSQCDVVRANGTVATGIGTRGAFSEETVVVHNGCNPNVSVMIQSALIYGYGHWPNLPQADSNRGRPAGVPGVHADAFSRNLPDGSSAAFVGVGSISGGSSFAGGATGGPGQGPNFRR